MAAAERRNELILGSCDSLSVRVYTRRQYSPLRARAQESQLIFTPAIFPVSVVTLTANRTNKVLIPIIVTRHKGFHFSKHNLSPFFVSCSGTLLAFVPAFAAVKQQPFFRELPPPSSAREEEVWPQEMGVVGPAPGLAPLPHPLPRGETDHLRLREVAVGVLDLGLGLGRGGGGEESRVER